MNAERKWARGTRHLLLPQIHTLHSNLIWQSPGTAFNGVAAAAEACEMTASAARRPKCRIPAAENHIFQNLNNARRPDGRDSMS